MHTRPPLAWLNLLHNKVRTLVALAGICFAVTLLFMQLGFLDSALRAAMLVYDALDFDLVLTSPNYVVLTQPETFPRARLYQVKADPNVRAVMPLYISRQLWRNPDTRLRRAIVVLGVNPADPISRLPDLAEQLPGLARPDTALVDRLSRPEVGRRAAGTLTEAGSHRVKSIGTITIGPGFETGLVVVSDQTFSRLLRGRSLADVSLGLIKLRPGADPEEAAARLRSRLPPDVRVLTRSEVTARERRYWLISTSIGIIFGTGVLVALLFGLVITYQVLSMEVAQRLSEYATLKAMGFADASLSRIVLQQGLILGAASYVPGFLFAEAIYRASGSVTGLPVGMTVARAAGVFVVTLVVCAVSGLLALRVLRRADPVDLF